MAIEHFSAKEVQVSPASTVKGLHSADMLTTRKAKKKKSRLLVAISEFWTGKGTMEMRNVFTGEETGMEY